MFYQSAANPWPFAWTISGAKESTIPQIVNVLSLDSFFPNLKSTSYNTIQYKTHTQIHLLMSSQIRFIFIFLSQTGIMKPLAKNETGLRVEQAESLLICIQKGNFMYTVCQWKLVCIILYLPIQNIWSTLYLTSVCINRLHNIFKDNLFITKYVTLHLFNPYNTWDFLI